jgi:hypothetical protein
MRFCEQPQKVRLGVCSEVEMLPCTFSKPLFIRAADFFQFRAQSGRNPLWNGNGGLL